MATGFSAETSIAIELITLQEGQQAVVENIQGGKNIVRKMLGLGIRKGTEIHLLKKRQQGCVLASKGTRLALSNSMARCLSVSVRECL